MRIIESFKTGGPECVPLISSIKYKTFFSSNQGTRDNKKTIITFERPHYQLFPPELPHLRVINILSGQGVIPRD